MQRNVRFPASRKGRGRYRTANIFQGAAVVCDGHHTLPRYHSVRGTSNSKPPDPDYDPFGENFPLSEANLLV
jgi:hypothetical protein